MKIERTKNASRNIVFGMLLKVYQIILPFVIRTIMLYELGEQYLGLNSLFTSILQVLNLAELGVGSAMIYSMYEPISKDDTERICALMKLYKLYYFVIGLIIALIGLVLTPLIPKLIQGEVPSDINIYILYFLNLGATVLSYWLFAYKNALLHAHQRIDVISKVTLFTTTIQYAIQLFMLIVLKNYYLYILAMLLTQALTNIVTAYFADRMYPNYHPRGELIVNERKQINERIRDLFTAKIGGVIVNSVDSVVISAFLGLTALAIYQNYFFIMSAVIGFIAIIFNACTAGIGNSIIVETKQKNYEDFNKFTFVISWISGWCCCCFLCLYQPFMELWVGKTYMLNFSAVISFCIYFFVFEINQLLNTYKDAAGIWRKDRFRPLVTASMNLMLNLISVQFMGIYGVIFSTVISMVFIGMPWLLGNLFDSLFERKQILDYIKKLFIYTFCIVISCTLTYKICTLFSANLIQTMLIRILFCCFIPNCIFLLFYRKTKEYKQSLVLLDHMTKGKMKKVINALGMKEV